MFLPCPSWSLRSKPTGCLKRASEYPRPDEERGGDLYRSERSERRSDRDSPSQDRTLRNDDEHIFVGWVGGTPVRFFICAVALVALSSVLAWLCAVALGRPCSARSVFCCRYALSGRTV